jgi:dTDP-3,4-didehydro-2,6-dideoxy-alpha-D-glucose 3-reductase
MKILFIGYSNLVKRRILPFINQVQSLDVVDIAKHHTQKEDKIETFPLTGKIFNSFEEAISDSGADLAYISTVNSAHYEWTKKALDHGMNVIVDKPAFMDLNRTEELARLAKSSKLLLAESTVYSFHPQISTVLNTIQSKALVPINLTVNFSFPPLNPGNFRYSKDLGGGAINDLGPYAVSAGRIFFREIPEEIFGSVNSFDPDTSIETSFSILAVYSNGRTMIGNFGFNTEYINRINIIGSNFTFEINRVFTPPNDIENEILCKFNNSVETIKTQKSNSFINFLNHVIKSIQSGDSSYFTDALLMDATSFQLLKNKLLRNK